MNIITIVLLIHVFLALGLVGLILLQHGKGADAGAAFGSGASATVFGSQGAGSFMTRTTKWLAILFFITSGSLAYLSRGVEAPTDSVMDAPATQEAQLAPVEQDGDMPPVSSDEQQGDVPAVEAAEEPVVEDDGEDGDGSGR